MPCSRTCLIVCSENSGRNVVSYRPDIVKNREEARNIMKKAGYGADKRLAVKVSVRNTPPFRDPAIILIDQLKKIYILGELDVIDTTQWYAKLIRKLNLGKTALCGGSHGSRVSLICGSRRAAVRSTFWSSAIRIAKALELKPEHHLDAEDEQAGFIERGFDLAIEPFRHRRPRLPLGA